MQNKGLKQDKSYRKEHYRGPLITNGVSLGYIKFYPWIALVLSGLFYAMTQGDPYGFIKSVFFLCIVVNLTAIIFSLFNGLINRFKSITFLMISLTVLSLLIILNFIGLGMFVGTGAEELYSGISLVFVIILLLFFTGFCLFYAWYYLPQNKGKVWSFNQVGNKSKKKNKSNDYLTILGCAFLAPLILTGHIQKVFGVIGSLFLTFALSAVFVDALYAAYYVRKYPDSEELF